MHNNCASISGHITIKCHPSTAITSSSLFVNKDCSITGNMSIPAPVEKLYNLLYEVADWAVCENIRTESMGCIHKEIVRKLKEMLELMEPNDHNPYISFSSRRLFGNDQHPIIRQLFKNPKHPVFSLLSRFDYNPVGRQLFVNDHHPGVLQLLKWLSEPDTRNDELRDVVGQLQQSRKEDIECSLYFSYLGKVLAKYLLEEESHELTGSWEHSAWLLLTFCGSGAAPRSFPWKPSHCLDHKHYR